MMQPKSDLAFEEKERMSNNPQNDEFSDLLDEVC
jgi:hypothetical protein